jgi:hypothetical protein
MPYVRGFLIGVLLAILALYVEDHIKPGRETLVAEPQKIANSDVAAQRLPSLSGCAVAFATMAYPPSCFWPDNRAEDASVPKGVECLSTYTAFGAAPIDRCRDSV